MADNLNIDPGTTLTVGTDLIGGVHYQRVKIVHGDDGTANDAGTTTPFPVTIASATLGTVTIAGTVSLSTTKVTVDNVPHAIIDSGSINIATATLGTVTIIGNINVATATLGTVTVALSSTAVSISNIPHAIIDSGNINIATATLGTVTIVGNVNIASATLGTISLSTTAVTITNAASINVNVATATLGTVTIAGSVNVATATLGTVTVALSSTAVTISNSPLSINVATATLGTVTISGNVNIATATLGTVTISGSVTNSVSTIPIVGRTLTNSTGSLNATTGTVTLTPTNRAKVYAFSITTTSSTEVICIFHTGGLELWRATLLAPSGANAGANLAVAPPNFLFASRTGTAVSLSLSTAVTVHYSTAYFDEV